MNNTFIRFGSKLFRQIVGIPMVSNCAPVVVVVVVISDLTLSLSDNNQADIIEAFASTSRRRNTENPYFDQIVNQIYHAEIKQVLLIPKPLLGY